jgi:hypothetical protein
VAFAAGVLTHTVADGIFHGVIDYFLTRWNETGLAALGLHRQIETLYDMVLWGSSRPRQADDPLRERSRLSFKEIRFLLDFIHSVLPSPPGAVGATSVPALRWAFTQQLFLLTLFQYPWAFRLAHWARFLSGGRSDCISGLFYPPVVSAETFPVLKKMDLNHLSNGTGFTGDLKALAGYAVNETVQKIPSEGV